MTRWWPRLPLLACGLILAAALALQLRMSWPGVSATRPTPVVVTRQVDPAHAPDDPPHIPVDPQVMAFRQATDLRGALESARRQFAADAPMLRSLSEEARVVCAIVRRPDASAQRVEGDPNRRAWLDQLMRRCAGLLDSDLAQPAPTAQALALWNQQLPMVAYLRGSLEDGVELARAHVARSPDPQLIAESLRFLLDQDHLPLGEIFAGVNVPSNGDIEASLMFAADWIGCLRGDSCGADGLWTLYTCAQFGCPEGSDLPRAYYRILPAQQYEIARRLVRWAIR